MMNIAGWLCIIVGMLFFLAGTVALIRFPDLYTRLHALTKADNLGLGFVITGLAIQSASFSIAFKLVLIWLLIMLASASASHLISRAARAAERKPEKLT